MVEYVLKKNEVVSIGRDSSNTIIFDDKRISSVHVFIKQESNAVIISDNASTNGTFVNGNKITTKQITSGDIIGIGNIKIKFIDGKLVAGNEMIVNKAYNDQINSSKHIGAQSRILYSIKAAEVMIGRDPSCDFLVSDNTASRKHAKITKQGKNYVISDNNSSYGTFINGQKIQSQELVDGNRIKIGNSIFYFAKGKIFDGPPNLQTIKNTFSFKEIFSRTKNIVIAGSVAVALIVLLAVGAIAMVGGKGLGNSQRALKVENRNYDNGDVLASTNAGVSVFIPVYNGLDDCEVSISKEALKLDIEGATINAYDISINNTHEFDNLIKLTIPYDEKKIEKDQNIEDCVVAGYYNENTKEIEPVIYEIDEQNRVIIITNHLSTYMTITYPNSQRRSEEFGSAYSSRNLSNIIPSDAQDIYQSLVQNAKNDMELPLNKEMEIAFKAINSEANFKAFEFGTMYNLMKSNSYAATKESVGGATKVDLHITGNSAGKVMDSIDQGLTYLGRALVVTQLLMDYQTGDDLALWTNTTKNLVNLFFSETNITGTCGFAAFFLEYSLDTFKSGLLNQEQDKYWVAYDAYYNDNHKNAEAEIYEEIHNIFEKYSSPLYENSASVFIKDSIDQMADDYVNEFWNLPNNGMLFYFKKLTWGGTLKTLDKDDPLLKDIKPAIVKKAKNELYKDIIIPAVKEIKKTILYEQQVEILKQEAEMERFLSSTWTLGISEIKNFDNASYMFGNGVILIESRIEGAEDWVFYLDGNGRHSSVFIFTELFKMGVPEYASVYATTEDFKARQNEKIVQLNYDTINKTLNIILGDDGVLEEFKLESDKEKYYFMGTSMFTVSPYHEDFEYIWNRSERVNEGTAVVRLNRAGWETISVQIYNKDNVLIGSKSKEIYVEENELNIEPSNAEPKVGEEIELVLISNSIYFSKCKVVWDFCEYGKQTEFSGDTISASFENAGALEINATVYYVDEFGDEIYLGSTECLINVLPAYQFKMMTDGTYATSGVSKRFSIEPQVENLTYYWDMGDGTGYYGSVVDHTFIEEGQRFVYAWVLDGDKVIFEGSLPIVVQEDEMYPPPEPTAAPAPDINPDSEAENSWVLYDTVIKNDVRSNTEYEISYQFSPTSLTYERLIVSDNDPSYNGMKIDGIFNWSELEHNYEPGQTYRVSITGKMTCNDPRGNQGLMIDVKSFDNGDAGYKPIIRMENSTGHPSYNYLLLDLLSGYSSGEAVYLIEMPKDNGTTDNTFKIVFYSDNSHIEFYYKRRN